MIITKLQSGMGNQMFQYALGRHLARLNNTVLKLDTSSYNHQSKNDTQREYSLGCFNTIEDFAKKEDTKKMHLPKMATRNIFLRIYRKIFRGLSARKPLYKRTYVREPSFGFCADVLKINKGAYLSGNWQNEKYFKDITDIIRKDFTLKIKSDAYKKMHRQILNTAGIVSLHIRRGDYISNEGTNKYHGICSIDYYKSAVSLITHSVQNPTFFIFSDDMEWVKENLKIEHPMIFVSGNSLTDSEELTLMSKCKHNIIANSSFSWWGAWLNNNPNKVVVAPKKWFLSLEREQDNPCPDSWIKI